MDTSYEHQYAINRSLPKRTRRDVSRFRAGVEEGGLLFNSSFGY